MTNEPGSVSNYALRPVLSARPWAVAAALFGAGVSLAVFGHVHSSKALLVIGYISGGLGLFLFIAAGFVIASRTQYVTLTDYGFEVSGPGYNRSIDWADVTAVNATPDGSRLVIASGRVPRTFIQAPGGHGGQVMEKITNDITTRLARRKF